MENKDVMVEGLTLNADTFNNMVSNKIVILGARYENMTDFKDKTKMVRKLALTIEIDKFRLEYFPNNKAKNKLVKKFGFYANKWIGKTAELEVKTLLVAGNEHDVLCIKE